MMLDQDERKHADLEDEKLSTAELREESPDSVAERMLTDASTTTAARRPVQRHLLDQLRNYPRLRDILVGYLLVQERMDRYEDIMSELEGAGDSPNQQFWARLHANLRREGLRADFPNSLFGDRQFEELVETFEAERLKAIRAAHAGRNPHQSAQSARAAYEAVGVILATADDLSTCSKEQARTLLDILYETVNKIFADYEEPPAGDVSATNRSISMDLADTAGEPPAGKRDTRNKLLPDRTSGPDNGTNQVSKKGAS